MKVTRIEPEYTIVAPKEAIISWKHNDVTKQIIQIVNNEVLHRSLQIGDGETVGDRTAEETNRAVGYLDGMRFMLEVFEMKFIVEDEDDRERDEEEEAA